MKARQGKKKASTTGASSKRRTRRTATVEEIRLRAYEIYVRGGRKDGRDIEDWFQAESELIEETPKQHSDSRRGDSHPRPPRGPEKEVQ